MKNSECFRESFAAVTMETSLRWILLNIEAMSVTINYQSTRITVNTEH